MKNIIEISNKKPSLTEYYSKILNNKYLIYQITKKEFLTAYTQSFIGIFYHALVPLFQTLVFNFFLNKIEFSPDEKIPSFLFIFISLTIWNLFVTNALKTSQVFLTNRKYLSKLYFYKFSLVISSMLISLMHFIINFLILMGVILYFKINFNVLIDLDFKILLLPLIVVIALLLSSGLGMIICSVSVRYRDLVFGTNFLIQILLFLSPVLYGLNKIDPNISFLFLFNPVINFLELFRWVFIDDYNLEINYIFAINLINILLIFIMGSKMFISAERKIADFV